ncbi:MAG: transposase, partial [Clostridiales bacterium]|nr:transposase [Clostridiales bacterium]
DGIKEETMTPVEFLRRFLLHVLPKDFMKKRSMSFKYPCEGNWSRFIVAGLVQQALSSFQTYCPSNTSRKSLHFFPPMLLSKQWKQDKTIFFRPLRYGISKNRIYVRIFDQNR